MNPRVPPGPATHSATVVALDIVEHRVDLLVNVGARGPQGPPGPPDEAPIDGTFYGRQDATWVPLPPLDYLPLVGGTLQAAAGLTRLEVLSPTAASSATILATAASATMSLTGAGGASVVLNAPAGFNRYLGGGVTGVGSRWAINLGNADPETGANAGSNFSIWRFDDAGLFDDTGAIDERAIIGTPLSIERATGIVTFEARPVFPGGYLPLTGGTLTGPLTIQGPNSLGLTGPAGQQRGIIGLTGMTARWQMLLGDQSPETGGDAGSDFVLYAGSDTGTVKVPTAFRISRATEIATFGVMPSIPGGAANNVLSTNGAGGLSWTANLPGGPFLPIVAGPTAPLTGELYLPAAPPSQPAVAANRAYVDAQDTLLQDQISVLGSNLLFVGGLDVPNDDGRYTAASGLLDGPLPPSAPGNAQFYVIVVAGGAPPAGEIPAGTYSLGDWLVSTGTGWIQLPIGQAPITAVDVATIPAIGALGPNVWTGLSWLDQFKLSLAGGTMTGPLRIPAPDQLIINGPIGVNRSILGQIDGVNNWRLNLGQSAVSQPFAAFSLQRFDGAGVLVDTPLTINASNGSAIFSSSVNAGLITSTSDVNSGRNVVASAGMIAPVYIANGNGFSISHAVTSPYSVISSNSVDGGNRWQIRLGNAAAETGANAGSNFEILSYADDSTGLAQNLIGTPLSINRATGRVTLTPNPTAGLFFGTNVGMVNNGIGQLLITGALNAPSIITNGITNYGAITMNGILSCAGTMVFTGNTAGRHISAVGAGGTRMLLRIANGDVETGNNEGSNFSLHRYDDAGVLLGMPLSIARSTGVATLSAIPSFPGGSAGDVLATDGLGGLSWSSSLQDQINQLASNLLFVGGIDVPNNAGQYTIASGIPAGPLPGASPANRSFYVIVTAGGSPPAGAIPAGLYAPGDWLASDGTQWIYLPIGQADITAPNVAMTPPVSGWSDVQQAITGIVAGYLPLTGGTMTGALSGTAANFSGNVQCAALVALDTIQARGGVGLNIVAPAGWATQIVGSNSGGQRWNMHLGDATAETGGNTGSNFQLICRADDGVTPIHTPLTINRATGIVTFEQPPVIPGYLALSGGTLTGGLVGTTANFSSTLTVSSTVNAQGLLGVTGNAHFASQISLDGFPAGRFINATGTTGSRWRAYFGDASPESVGNAGSNFVIQNYDDAALLLGTPLAIERATGIVTFGSIPVAPGLVINGAGGTNRSIIGQTNGTARWGIVLGDSTAPDIAGSNFAINAYNNDGTLNYSPITISRISASPTVNINARILQMNTATPIIGFSMPSAGQATIRGEFADTFAGWTMRFPNSTPRTGGNAGADFDLFAIGDTGVPLPIALHIERATGVCTFSADIVTPSNPLRTKDVRSVVDALAIVEQLDGFYYTDDNGRRLIGLSAQELQAVLPEVVYTIPPAPPPEPEPGAPPWPRPAPGEAMLGISYPKITALLVNAIKELKAEVDQLKATRH